MPGPHLTSVHTHTASFPCVDPIHRTNGPTGTKDTDVIGLGGLEAVAAAAAPLPIVAIGGVSAANAGDCVNAGCAGGWLAGMRGRGRVCSTRNP